MSVRQWSRDLAMGAKFAFTGGREGYVRLLLTGIGVGLGVALLLLTTAIPSALKERHAREDARSDYASSWGVDAITEPRDDTLVIIGATTSYQGTEVRGREMEAEGPKAPVPPGVQKLPQPGEMVVSPALKELLASDEGKVLRERLPDRIVGTIGEKGLIGPAELAFYRGGENLAPLIENGGYRIDHFGPAEAEDEPLDPILLLLILVAFVVLLMPVGVFIATAVRFGGERRDRRLAALRLIGTDSRMTRRIASGEAFAGALLGLAFGTAFFLIGRQVAGSVEFLDVSMYPSYLNPSPVLAVLVAVAVPAAAVLVTLLALRGVVIEPLGVVRLSKPARRRLWWRLLLPVAGLAMLYPMIGQGNEDGDFNQYLVIGGVILLLFGVTALLPWVVETVVARLGSGSVSWQLAVRRLQVSSGTAARMVNGIAVAVAGAIALQMLFASIEDEYTSYAKHDVTRAQMSVHVPEGVSLATTTEKFETTKGVDTVYPFSEGYVNDRPDDEDAERWSQVTLGGCEALREVASLPSCGDGDVFAVSGGEFDEATPELAKAGTKLWFSGDEGEPIAWTVPGDLKEAQSVNDPSGTKRGGFLFTPGALPEGAEQSLSGQVYLALDRSVPDAAEYVRNTAFGIDRYSDPMVWSATERDERFASIRIGLFVGAACVLLLIGVSLLVSQLEQLRERRKLLSALVAFGTRRRTLALSVLWQTALPIALGLVLASVVGLTLGAVLQRMGSVPVSVDWTGVLSMTGISAAVVAAVTLLSLPPLIKLMRPEGLRTE